jgi:hypothetical protein
VRLAVFQKAIEYARYYGNNHPSLIGNYHFYQWWWGPCGSISDVQARCVIYVDAYTREYYQQWNGSTVTDGYTYRYFRKTVYVYANIDANGVFGRQVFDDFGY